MPGSARGGPVTVITDVQVAAGRGRKAARTVSTPFRWINRERRRVLIIYPLMLITLGYLVAGIWLAATEPAWKATDTFSMVAGCVFFVIGTSLAVAHEARQEEQKKIMDRQETIMIKQGQILGEVRVIAGKTQKRLDESLENLTARTGEVPDTPPVEMQSDATSAVTVPQAESAPAASMPEAPSEDTEFQRVQDKLAELEDPSPIELAWEALNLDDSPEEKQKALQRFALESAIEAKADTNAVENLLKQTQVYALGFPAGDTSVPGHGTESDILHFTVDDAEGKDKVFMPLFTRSQVMRDALLRNPDWQKLSVLEVNGGDLIANRDSGVSLVVNPWSKLEWQLPSKADHLVNIQLVPLSDSSGDGQ